MNTKSWIRRWLPCVGVVLLSACTPTDEAICEAARRQTVQIVGKGSGVIIHRRDTGIIVVPDNRPSYAYTVLTNHHVVCEMNQPFPCDTAIQIQTFDGRTHDAKLKMPDSGEPFGDVNSDRTLELDLAVVVFSSPQSYPVATVGNSDQLRPGSAIHIFGFPAFDAFEGSYMEANCLPGAVTAVQENQDYGYNIVHSANTLPGNSGSPVLDQRGQLVGTHAASRLVQRFVHSEDKQWLPYSILDGTGYQLAIPINQFLKATSRLGLNAAELKGPTLPWIGRLPPEPQWQYPKTAADFQTRGLLRLHQGDWAGAFTDFNQALVLDPNYAEAYFYRGIVRRQQGSLSQALADFNQAISQHPGYAEAYVNRGTIFLEQNQLPSAIDDFQQAIQLQPASAAAYQNLGVAYALQTAQPPAPDASGGYYSYDYGIGESDYEPRACRYDETCRDSNQLAIEQFTQAIAADPSSASAYYNRGLVLAQQGNRQMARHDLQIAASLFQQHGETVAYNNALELLAHL